MAYLLAVLVMCAILHFVYESIVAPSLRLRLRYKLFALRDRARKLKIDCGASLPERHFHFLQDSINTMISVLYRFDFAAVFHIDRELRENAELRKRTEARSKMLDDCPIPEARAIRYESCKIVAYAVVVNNGVWSVCVLPFLLFKSGFSTSKRLIRQSLSMPQSEIQKAVPNNSAVNSLV